MPFYIMHSTDIWQPSGGGVSSKDGFKYLRAAMCNLTDFIIIVVAVPSSTTAALALGSLWNKSSSSVFAEPKIVLSRYGMG
jgi:hypothetical protein